MAAKGSEAKAYITEKLLEYFEGSFVDDKVIRIPINENGEDIQIKVTLTAAKDMVVNPNNFVSKKIVGGEEGAFGNETSLTEPTQEEKENIKKLIGLL